MVLNCFLKPSVFLSIKLVYLRLPFVIQAKAFNKSFKGAKCVSITITSSNINEVIRIILKISKPQKSTKCLQTSKNKKCV